MDDENNLIGLLKTELVNHKKYLTQLDLTYLILLLYRDIQELNKIVLQKDVVVQGLQDQVVNFLSHDYHALQVLCKVIRQFQTKIDTRVVLRKTSR